MCPQFEFIKKTVHKFVMCTVDIDSLYRQRTDTIKLNTSFPARQAVRDRLSSSNGGWGPKTGD